MAQHDIEITITKTGEVKAHIKGVKGKGCGSYKKLLADIVGKIKQEQATSEYYEPEEKNRIDIDQRH
jgi:hypothetical protein